ncbi:hypothetical protein MKX53_06700 [Psychrobacillus sp. FSL K6-4615]
MKVAIPEMVQVRIIEPTVNFRNAPSLQSTVTATGYANVIYVF